MIIQESQGSKFPSGLQYKTIYYWNDGRITWKDLNKDMICLSATMENFKDSGEGWVSICKIDKGIVLTVEDVAQLLS